MDLLVGADGIHSTMRELVFGPQHQRLRQLGFHAACTFTGTAIPSMPSDRFTTTDSADSAVGLYAPRDDKIAAWAIHRTPDPEPPADPHATVAATFPDLGWLVHEVLAHCCRHRSCTTTKSPRLGFHSGAMAASP
jgi:2-polyprenyl-6-methoxyphenol hydroxylase-like FAD-dependent oxidoreductase